LKYEQALDKLYKNLPEKTLHKERFEMPVAKSLSQGNRTVVSNFVKIMKTINRDEKHALKYITKQTGTFANIDSERLILKGRFSQKEIQNLINGYLEKFVLCHECRRPDTKMTEHKGIKMLKCEACGALSAVRE